MEFLFLQTTVEEVVEAMEEATGEVMVEAMEEVLVEAMATVGVLLVLPDGVVDQDLAIEEEDLVHSRASQIPNRALLRTLSVQTMDLVEDSVDPQQVQVLNQILSVED